MGQGAGVGTDGLGKRVGDEDQAHRQGQRFRHRVKTCRIGRHQHQSRYGTRTGVRDIVVDREQ